MKLVLSGVFTVFLLAFSISSVFAGEQIIISLDDTDQGAVLRVLHPTSEAVIETAKMKNYNTGVVTADYESTRSQVIFRILVTENGAVVDDWQSEPMPTNVPHEFDMRIGAKSVVVSPESEEEPVVEESVEDNVADEAEEAADGEATTTIDEGTADGETADSEVTAEDSGAEQVSLTGNAVQDSGVVSANRWYVVAGIIVILALFTLTGVFLHGKKRKNQMQVVTVKQSELMGRKSGDEAELEMLEKKVRENESRIRQLKRKDETKRKIADAKKRLAQDEAQLQKLEGKGNTNKDNALWGAS